MICIIKKIVFVYLQRLTTGMHKLDMHWRFSLHFWPASVKIEGINFTFLKLLLLSNIYFVWARIRSDAAWRLSSVCGSRSLSCPLWHNRCRWSTWPACPRHTRHHQAPTRTTTSPQSPIQQCSNSFWTIYFYFDEFDRWKASAFYSHWRDQTDINYTRMAEFQDL